MSLSAVRLPTLGGSVPLSCVSNNSLRMHAVIIIIIIIIIIIAVAAQYHTAAHTPHHTRVSTRRCDASQRSHHLSVRAQQPQRVQLRSMSAVKAIGQRRHTLAAEDSRRPHMAVSAVRLPTLGGSVPLSCVLCNHLRMHAVIKLG